MQKKVLIIHHEGSYGGGSKSALLVGKMLREAGFKVEFLIANNELDFNNILRDNGFITYLHNGRMGNISNYSGGPKILSRTFIKNLFFIKSTKKFIINFLKEKKYDYYIVNSSTMVWLVNYIKNGQKICFVRETKRNNFISYIQKNFLKKFDVICFISKYDLNLWKIKDANVEIIYDCVEVKFFFEKKINSGVKEVLYLGGENELKGWNIIKKLMNTDIKLNYHIAGYVNEENKVIGDNIKYYQVVDNVDFLYEMADVIVLPSTYPHQLMPIFEAGIYKVPVITSDFPLAHEHIKNNFNGILVPPNNVDAIIQAILTLDNNYDKKIFMIENNFLTSQCHTYQSVKNRLLEMFNKL